MNESDKWTPDNVDPVIWSLIMRCMTQMRGIDIFKVIYGEPDGEYADKFESFMEEWNERYKDVYLTFEEAKTLIAKRKEEAEDNAI